MARSWALGGPRTGSPGNGRLVPALVAGAAPGALLRAGGDDRPDENLFDALPPDALIVHVGPEPSRAPIRLAGVPEVLGLLRAIAGSGPARSGRAILEHGRTEHAG